MKGNFTLFLSGVEPRENFEVVSGVTKNVLFSYVYIRRRGLKEIEERLEKHKGMRILIDSGAFTFFKDEQYHSKPLEWWEKYIKNYTDFVKSHRDTIFACVELDIDDIVGEEQAEAWREQYFYPLEESGIKVIYVYHTNKPIDTFRNLCRRHNYVGFSYNELKPFCETQDNLETFVGELFNIAKEYGTKIHGFAITGNLLTKFPFFSADSTTWLVGSQFCQVNIFESGKIRQLPREKWKTEYIGKLESLGLKRKLLDIDAPYELMKASAIAYKQFEEYVGEIMYVQKYWSDKVNLKFKLPNADWFKTDMEDWQVKLADAGINYELDEPFAKTLLEDLYNLNNDITMHYRLEDLVEICALFGASGIKYNTKDKCIKFLKSIVKDLLNGGGLPLKEFDGDEDLVDTERLSLEREDYITEQESIEVELSREECGKLLPALLTAGYDKDEVEKDLISKGITPIYDKDGNIERGIKSLRKQKQISTKAFPRLSCSRCVMALKCPEYREGYICAYDKTFRKFNTRDEADVMDGMTSIANLALERVQKAYMVETSMGGMPTDGTSKAMKEAWDYLTKLKELQSQVMGEPISVQKTVVKGGTIETTTVKGSNPQKDGILSQIFSTSSDDMKTVDAEVL